jgi:hypothetical protein
MSRRADGALFAACAVVYLAIATRLGTSTLRTQFANGAYSDFFDIQAEALLRGDLALPANSIGIEAFVVDGREQMYFGLFPALLRMPVLAVTDRWFGELTVLSSFLAWVVFVVSAWALADRLFADRVRGLDHRLAALGAPIVWRVTIALGTPMSMLAGPAWVFSEAIMWGVATATLFQWRLLRELQQPSARNQLLVAGALVLAVLNRPTLGLGCLVMLIVVVAWRARRGVDAGTGRLGTAAAVSLLVLVVPNVLRFGRPLGPPMEQQVLSQIDEQRMRMLDYAGGDFVDPRYLPTNVVAYLRPDGMSISGTFPFLDAPRGLPTVFLDAVHDITYRTPSLVATSTALFLLGVVGAVLALRSLGDATSRRILVTAAVGLPAAGTLLIWGFIAPRYLADFVVVLLPLSVLGTVGVARRIEVSSGRTGAALFAGLVVVAAWSVATNSAIAVSSSYLTGPDGDAAEFVRLQGRDDFWRSTDTARYDDVGGFAFERTAPPSPGRVAVLGDCAAAYLSTGEPVDPWLTLGYGPNDFRQTFTVSVPAEPVDASILLGSMIADSPTDPQEPSRFEVRLVTTVDGDVRLDLSDEFGVVQYPLAIAAATPTEVTVTSDPVRRSLFFDVGGETVHFGHHLTRSLYRPGGQTVTFTDGGDDQGLSAVAVSAPRPAAC